MKKPEDQKRKTFSKTTSDSLTTQSQVGTQDPAKSFKKKSKKLQNEKPELDVFYF